MTSPRLPEEVIECVPMWRSARGLRLRPLPGGHSNSSWLVETEAEQAVLRIDACRVPPPVVDRRRELEVLRCAAAAGLAPAVLFADPTTGTLVTRFIAAEVLSAEEIRRPDTLRQVAAILKRVHSLPPPPDGYTLAAAGEIYLQAIERPDLHRIARRLVGELESLPVSDPVENRLCHMDPVAGNILRRDGRLMLIDWEFAVSGDPYFDLAAVVSYHRLSADESAALLAAYHGDPDATDWQRLTHLTRAYDALHWLWLVAAEHGDETSDVRRHRRELEARLGIVV